MQDKSVTMRLPTCPTAFRLQLLPKGGNGIIDKECEAHIPTPLRHHSDAIPTRLNEVIDAAACCIIMCAYRFAIRVVVLDGLSMCPSKAM